MLYDLTRIKDAMEKAERQFPRQAQAGCLIGLSMGECIRQMAEGTVRPDDVTLVITGNSLKDEKEVERAIRAYSKPGKIWGSNPDEARRLFLLFFEQGRVYQSRYDPGIFNTPSKGVGPWVERLEDIVWAGSTPNDE